MAENRGEDVPEAAADPTTKDILQWIAKGAYWIAYPIVIAVYHAVYYLVFGAVFMLKLLYRPLEFVLLPVVYLGKFILNCIAAPFRFLAKFETIYIYLGIAALVGISGGLVLNFIYGSLNELLGLNSDPKPASRTAKQYRKGKRKQKAKAEAPLMSAGHFASPSTSASEAMRKPKRGRNLLSQSIMEELDSDE